MCQVFASCEPCLCVVDIHSHFCLFPRVLVTSAQEEGFSQRIADFRKHISNRKKREQMQNAAGVIQHNYHLTQYLIASLVLHSETRVGAIANLTLKEVEEFTRVIEHSKSQVASVTTRPVPFVP
jgi:copper homeostasis protein CutC